LIWKRLVHILSPLLHWIHQRNGLSWRRRGNREWWWWNWRRWRGWWLLALNPNTMNSATLQNTLDRPYVWNDTRLVRIRVGIWTIWCRWFWRRSRSRCRWRNGRRWWRRRPGRWWNAFQFLPILRLVLWMPPPYDRQPLWFGFRNLNLLWLWQRRNVQWIFLIGKQPVSSYIQCFYIEIAHSMCLIRLIYIIYQKRQIKAQAYLGYLEINFISFLDFLLFCIEVFVDVGMRIVPS